MLVMTKRGAEALRTPAGKFAATLFTVGIVGVGFLAIPTLAGSAAYAFAETLGWRQSNVNRRVEKTSVRLPIVDFSSGRGEASEESLVRTAIRKLRGWQVIYKIPDAVFGPEVLVGSIDSLLVPTLQHFSPLITQTWVELIRRAPRPGPWPGC